MRSIVRVDGSLRFVVYVLVALGAAPYTHAQLTGVPRETRRQSEPDAFLNQQRAATEQIRKQIDEQLGRSQKTAFDWGGWYSTYFFIYDDGVESSRTFRRHDLRVWARLSLENGAHEFYVRPRLSLLDFNSGDSYDGNDDDIEGPSLERGYYRFDLARALGSHGSKAPDFNVVTTVGRDLVRFGNGFAVSMPLDHVSVRSTYRGFDLEAVGGKSVGSTQDVDLSRSATRSHRDFVGAQLKYTSLERHEPFVYALWQKDRNREAIYQPFQKFDYDSHYVGVGSTGEVVPRLRYETELVYEGGRSYGDRRFLRSNDIRAWAFQGQLEYLFPGKRKARTSLEYIFASGDNDRIFSPTSSIGGNTRDFTDTSFVGFGFRDTGLAFAPRYSNLHMWRLGGSIYPWPEHHVLRNLEVGSDWYLFYKHQSGGAVSDPTATRDSSFLGWEMDYFANWQIKADLSWTTRFGTFFPGSAFDDETVRTFLLMGLTWSF